MRQLRMATTGKSPATARTILTFREMYLSTIIHNDRRNIRCYGVQDERLRGRDTKGNCQLYYAINRCTLKSHAFLFDEAASLVEIVGTLSRPDAFSVASNLIAGQG